MRAYFLTILIVAICAVNCGKNKDDNNGDASAATEGAPSKDKADDASKDSNDKKPSGPKNDSGDPAPKPPKDPKKKEAKKPGPAPDTAGAPKPAVGDQHCQATFEDGYWKVWAGGEAKPSLPASGPAPAGTCTDETPSDLMGGSVNGKPAGSQRVLLKTAEGCYVPNGGGPVGPLLGACTGVTWRVPY